MDRFLRRQLDAIARDRRSGAAELALRAVAGLRAWLRRHPKPTENELLEIARALLRGQPAMAPMLRLANEVALAVDTPEPPKTLSQSVKELSNAIRKGPDEIGRKFFQTLRRGPRRLLNTYSYSSTVLKAFARARSRIWWVFCSESQPGLEGRRTAQELLKTGMGVGLVNDGALSTYMAYAHAFVIGADAIEDYGLVNKAGTNALVAYAGEIQKPVWVLADTSKFLPWYVAHLRPTRFGPSREIWTNPPTRLVILNLYFDYTEYSQGVRILTERGWKTPREVRRELKKIRVSPRLKTLAADARRLD